MKKSGDYRPIGRGINAHIDGGTGAVIGRYDGLLGRPTDEDIKPDNILAGDQGSAG